MKLYVKSKFFLKKIKKILDNFLILPIMIIERKFSGGLP